MNKAHETIREALRTSKRPYILSSFGKDSLAVIDLCSQYGVRDVLYLEDRDEVVDSEHITRTVERYGLNVLRMTSGRALLYFMGGEPYLLGFPFVTDRIMMPIPTNLDPYVEGRPYTCIDERLRAPLGSVLPSGADLLILGFKLTDWENNSCRVFVDQWSDEQKANYLSRYQPVQDYVPGLLRVCYPLLDWSHDDVWDYLERRQIPASDLMYDGREKREHTNPVCYRCHDPSGDSIVECPRAGQRIMNLAHFTKDDFGLEQLRRMNLFEARAG